MDTKSNLPPVKIAVLIDGGFFIKRFNSIYNKDRMMSGKEVAAYLYTFAHKHVGAGNILYRIFYYDCIPFGKRMQNPIRPSATLLRVLTVLVWALNLQNNLRYRHKKRLAAASQTLLTLNLIL